MYINNNDSDVDNKENVIINNDRMSYGNTKEEMFFKIQDNDLSIYTATIIYIAIVDTF